MAQENNITKCIVLLGSPLQILHCSKGLSSLANQIPSQRRDYEDRLRHTALQPDEIQRNLGPLLILTMTIKL